MMETQFKLLDDVGLSRRIKPALETALLPWRFRNRSEILVVVDTAIGYTPGDDFGVGSVIELIRNTRVGCLRFKVDIAVRDLSGPTIEENPIGFEPAYTGFRFDMEQNGVPVINRYEQIWCFGFDGEGAATTLSAAERAQLCSWMDVRKGGLFGTGDHAALGAAMCSSIPRLGTMRRWTQADGVPPIGGPDRIDTLRPPSAAFEPGAPDGPAALKNSPHQGDLTLQPIRWTPWKTRVSRLFRSKRPHPVLCHPRLGPINVMPDHAHEGLCIAESEVQLEGECSRADGSVVPEYPAAVDGGSRPTPEIIATGSTLGDPPYNFAKHEQPARAAFPMISIYDGHRAGVGRVATDSTWHHWMDINIANIKTANGNDWEKVSRYFINLALWLNPPGWSTRCLFVDSLTSHFTFPGVEEFQADLPTRELGQSLRGYLTGVYGSCWVSQIVWDLVWRYRPKPWEILQELAPAPGLGQLDGVEIEEMILGEIVQQTLKPAKAIMDAAQRGKVDPGVALMASDALGEEVLENAFKDLSKQLDVRLKGMSRALKAF